MQSAYTVYIFLKMYANQYSVIFLLAILSSITECLLTTVVSKRQKTKCSTFNLREIFPLKELGTWEGLETWYYYSPPIKRKTMSVLGSYACGNSAHCCCFLYHRGSNRGSICLK